MALSSSPPTTDAPPAQRGLWPALAWLKRDRSATQTHAVALVKPMPLTGLRFWAIFVATSLALIIDGTANFAVSTGLPYVQGLVATTPDESSWILTLFNAPYYSMILLSPWLYARFSRKRLLVTGLLVFAFASLALCITPSFGWLLVLRLVQGAALGCVFVPAGILLFTSLPLKALALGVPWFAFIALGAGALGTLLGGYVSETFGAGALYLPNAFVALLAVALLWSQAPEADQPQPDLKLDIVGLTCGLLCFGGMQYLANEAERRNWFDSEGPAIAVAVVIVSAFAFILWELRLAQRPHVNVRMFREYRNFAVGSTINVVLGGIGYSVVLLTNYLETSIATTATLAGAVVALRICTYAIGIAAAFLLVSRKILDLRIVVASGAVATAICLLGFAWQMTPTSEVASFVVISLVFGLAFSVMSQPVPPLLIGSLPREVLAGGVAIYKLSAVVGLMIASATVQTIVDHRAANHATDIAGSVTAAQPAVRSFLSDGGSLAQLARVAGTQAQTMGFRDAMVWLALATLLVVPSVAFAAIRPRGS